MSNLNEESCKIAEIIKKSILIEDGNPAQYRLQTRTDSMDEYEPYRKFTFGERDKNKSHNTILMVGETGTGKTTLINVMINNILNVKKEDKVWFEITDDQSDHQSSVHSQTSSITVYGFYLQESPIHLTIIDTPGYGDTRDIDMDKNIAMRLLNLSESAEGVRDIDAVCLVINSTQNRLSDRQQFIFDAIQSLFGKDVAVNIVLLFTHSDGGYPKNALTAVKEAEIKCAVNDQNQPVFFLFNNRQVQTSDEKYNEEYAEEHEQMLEQSWHLSNRGWTGFFNFLDSIKSKTLKMTQDVLQKWKEFEVKINNLQSQVHNVELKQKELKQTQEALEQNKEHVKNNKNFEYEVEVPYKERVDIDPAVAKAATCCSVCEENCHYPGCWLVKNLSWCEVMKDGNYKVCTNKCHYSKHVKEAKIYEQTTKKETRTFEDLKKKYEDKIGDSVSVVKKLEEELQTLEKEKIKLVNEAFDCVETLQMIALSTDSLIILQHSDFLTEKLKEISEPEKATKLENIRKRVGEEKVGVLGYIRYLQTNKHEKKYSASQTLPK